MRCTFFRVVIIISFISIICISDVSKANKNENSTKDIDLQVVVDPSKSQYKEGEDLELDVKLYNKGEKDILLLGPLLPEGLRVRFSIKKSDRKVEYNSISILMGGHAAGFYRDIYLQPLHFVGARFKIAAKIKNKIRFLEGKYKIKASYYAYNKRQKENVIPGFWYSKEVSITISGTSRKK